MSIRFEILRAMVFVIILSMVLASIPVVYGDIKTALLVSAGTFFLSVLISGVLMFFFRRG